MRKAHGQADIIMTSDAHRGNLAGFDSTPGATVTDRRRLELKADPNTESAIERFVTAVDPYTEDAFYGESSGEVPPDGEPDRSDSSDATSPRDAPFEGFPDKWTKSQGVSSGSFVEPEVADPLPADPAGRRPDVAGCQFICPGCGNEVCLDAVPANGLIQCPTCNAEFFGAAQLSSEDQQLIRQMELERELASERLGDLHRNVVLLERRGLFRTRSYLIVAMAVCLAAALQSSRYGYHRLAIHEWNWKLGAFSITILVGLTLAWLCLRKIRATNAELAVPVQTDPTTPPDFSTLSDGSQVQDIMAKNLERLGGL